jgi:hypothetical protein
MIAAEKLKHHPGYLQRQRFLQMAEITAKLRRSTRRQPQQRAEGDENHQLNVHFTTYLFSAIWSENLNYVYSFNQK